MMSMSFRKFFFVEEDFGHFQQVLQKRGQTFPQLLQHLQGDKPTGQGGNADFYRVPDSRFGVRVVRRGFQPQDDASPELTAAHDPFDGENFGQPVANYGKNVQVLRLQQGTPAGMPFKYDKDKKDQAVQTFRQQITHAAKMPVEEYVRLFKSIVKLNEKGYVVDPSKSGNLLIDPQTGRFNLVDINKHEGDGYKNSAGEIIQMLMNNFHFSQNFSQDQEMKALAQEIIRKAEAAAQQSGLQGGFDSSSAKYSYDLAGLGKKEEPSASPSGPAFDPNEVW